jgi:HD domain
MKGRVLRPSAGARRYRNAAMTAREFGSLNHLAHRFFWALSPSGPGPSDEAWALVHMLPGERQLWERMSGPDRRHAIGVARETTQLLGMASPPREVLAAALLHDVGKVESGFGTFARAAITSVAIVFGRSRVRAWADHGTASGRNRYRARVGSYFNHDQLGARLLERVGSEPLTSAWAREHHSPPETWTIDPTIGAALKAADGD